MWRPRVIPRTPPSRMPQAPARRKQSLLNALPEDPLAKPPLALQPAHSALLPGPSLAPGPGLWGWLLPRRPPTPFPASTLGARASLAVASGSPGGKEDRGFWGAVMPLGHWTNTAVKRATFRDSGR